MSGRRKERASHEPPAATISQGRDAEACKSNAGHRWSRWALSEVLDWVRGRNPAVSIGRILDELLDLCETGRVRAWWPVERDGKVLTLCATFEPIPNNYWMATGFSHDNQGRPTGKVYSAVIPRGVTVEALFSRDDVLRELQPLADAGTKLPSRLKSFWTDAEIQIMDWLDENGCPRPRDGNQAILETWVAEWLAKHGYEASESSIRRHVKRCISTYRKKIGA